MAKQGLNHCGERYVMLMVKESISGIPLSLLCLLSKDCVKTYDKMDQSFKLTKESRAVLLKKSTSH